MKLFEFIFWYTAVGRFVRGREEYQRIFMIEKNYHHYKVEIQFQFLPVAFNKYVLGIIQGDAKQMRKFKLYTYSLARTFSVVQKTRKRHR